MKKSSRGICARGAWARTLACLLVVLGGCGGGGEGGNAPLGSPSLPTSSLENVQSISVEAGPGAGVNQLFTSVTICVPGSTEQCQTIDHVLVDTGSTGLRIFASVLPASFSLPQKNASPGIALVECAHFADGYTWGPVKEADVRVAGERAKGVAVQIVGDTQFPAVPRSCSGSGPSQGTVQQFGANGVLGVGVFEQDCGPACAQSDGPQIYFACTATRCQTTSASLAQQVKNPVASFETDNNGVLIRLPAIAAGGAAKAAGSLIFGIGTQANNGLGPASVFMLRADTGDMTTTYKKRTFKAAIVDSGSNAHFFQDGEIPLCASGFYCPSSTQEMVAGNQGTAAPGPTTPFSVANADALFAGNPGYKAFNTLAGSNLDPDSFIWGLPLFFGRSVFIAIEGKNTPKGAGPYFAY